MHPQDRQSLYIYLLFPALRSERLFIKRRLRATICHGSESFIIPLADIFYSKKESISSLLLPVFTIHRRETCLPSL